MPEFEPLTTPLSIGVVADTHIYSTTRSLPILLMDGLHGSDFIFHAGDICIQRVLDELSEIAPVFAVQGNNDDPELLRALPLERWFKIGAFKVGLLHGHSERQTAIQTAWQRMTGNVDAVVYGHSHRAEVTTRDGLLMINPGSPTQPRSSRIRSYARVAIGERIETQIYALP